MSADPHVWETNQTRIECLLDWGVESMIKIDAVTGFLQSCCSTFPLNSPLHHLKATGPLEVTLIVCDSSILLLPRIYSTFLLLYYGAMNYLDNWCLQQVMDCFLFFFYLLGSTDVLRNRFYHTTPPIRDQTLFYLFILLL